MRFKRLLRVLTSLVVIGFFVLHAASVFELPLGRMLENAAYDMRMKATLPTGRDDRIVIADIDEASLREIGQWPWPRSKLASAVDTLFDHYDIAVLGFDILFAEPNQDTGLAVLQQLADGSLKNDAPFINAFEQLAPELAHDQRFADSLKDRNVVLGYVFKTGSSEQSNTLPDAVAELPEALVGQLPFSRPTGYSGNLALLQNNAAGGYFDNPQVDPDGIFRRVPLVQEYQGQLYGSLALNVARAALGWPDFDMQVAANNQGYLAVESLALGDIPIAVSAKAAALVPFRGPVGSFDYLSLADIINKRLPKEALQGRVVLVGTSAPGLLDLRSTPVAKLYPGVEIHANIISGIFNGSIKQQPQYILGMHVLALVGIGLLMTLLLSRFSPLWNLIATVLLIAAIVGSNLWAWNQGMVLPLAPLLLLTLALYLLNVMYGYFIESRGKRTLTRLFGQYVPPGLVDEMAASPEKISLDGESREMTVLFSDVRGFTTISEGLDPRELTQLMNAFLTPITAVIHQHRGTIDKYMGDAVMAFWGAPLADPHHARNALNAAMAMLKALEQLQDEIARRGWSPIKVGIGLNTGPMSVGNMGSEYRMAYTVLGDSVNLGARIEGLTKQYGAELLISEFTLTQVPEYACLEIDLVCVKGKDQAVAIHQPIGLRDELNQAQLDKISQFNAAVVDYRAQRWDAAEHKFTQLEGTLPNPVVCQMYIGRIVLFRSNPPAADWDGVFVQFGKS